MSGFKTKETTVENLWKGNLFYLVKPTSHGNWLQVLNDPTIVDGFVYFRCGNPYSPAHGEQNVKIEVGRAVEVLKRGVW